MRHLERATTRIVSDNLRLLRRSREREPRRILDDPAAAARRGALVDAGAPSPTASSQSSPGERPRRSGARGVGRGRPGRDRAAERRPPSSPPSSARSGSARSWCRSTSCSARESRASRRESRGDLVPRGRVASRAAAGAESSTEATVLRLGRSGAPLVAIPAVILFTSGTSGVSKGAVLTHGGIRAAAANAAEALGFGPRRRRARRGAVLARARTVDGARRDPRDAAARSRVVGRFDPARDARVRWPRPARRSCSASRRCASPSASAARSRRAGCRRSASRTSAARPFPVEVTREFEATFGADVYEGYGLTEISGIATTYRQGQPRKAGSVGLPARRHRASHRRADGARPAGEVGEVQFRGSSVIPGYWRGDGAALAPVSGDGWLATGDLGYLDDDGYLFLVDRLKDMIIRNGYNVYPREVEEVLYAHPDVLEAVVVGVPDARIGEEVVALVRPRAGRRRATRPRCRRGCESASPRTSTPATSSSSTRCRQGPTGKILKREIDRDALARRAGASSTASRPRPAGRAAARTAPRRASGRPTGSCGAASAASRRSSRFAALEAGARCASASFDAARLRSAAARRDCGEMLDGGARLARVRVERGPDRARGDDRVRDARVEPARAERREQVRRLADEQHAAARVGELAARAPAGRRRSRPTSRGRRTSASITRGSQLLTPSTPLKASASSSGRHWRSTRQWPANGDEAARCARRPRGARSGRSRSTGSGASGSSAVSTMTKAFSVRGPSSGIPSERAHVRARAVGADRVSPPRAARRSRSRTVTPSPAASTPVDRRSPRRTRRRPRCAAASSSCSVTTWGRLVAAGMHAGRRRRIGLRVELPPAVERALREPDQPVVGELVAEARVDPSSSCIEAPWMKIARLPGRTRSAAPASTTVTGTPERAQRERSGQPDRARRRRRSCAVRSRAAPRGRRGRSARRRSRGAG